LGARFQTYKLKFGAHIVQLANKSANEKNRKTRKNLI